MSKTICFLEQLPDEDLRGPGMRHKTDCVKGAKDFVHRHASEAGLALAIISFAMVVLP